MLQPKPHGTSIYRNALSFRVKAVHHRNERGIQHAKNNERPPPDVVETNRRDLDNHKDEHPVPPGSNSLHGCSGAWSVHSLERQPTANFFDLSQLKTLRSTSE